MKTNIFKKLLYAALFCASALSLHSQTNRLQETGNIGIGILDPTALLTIQDAGNATLRIGDNTNRTNSNVQIKESLAVWAPATNAVSGIGAVDTNYFNSGNNSTWAGALLQWYGNDSNHHLNTLPLNGAAVLYGQNSNRLMIAVNNNAPINFASPSGILTTITTEGKMGIRTQNPDALLTIQGDGSVPLALNVGGNSNARLRVRHIEGKSHQSGELDNLFLQHDVNYNTYINCGSSTGNVAIGTWSPTHKLTVNGAIKAKEVIVESNWADYVFDENYELQPLIAVEKHIKEKKRLPGIPSANEIASEGVSIGEMQALLLAKIEELTLHQIAQEKRINQQNKRIEELETENQKMRPPQVIHN